MRFAVDLHLHSRYAYATSRYADLEHLARWAQLKGVGLFATGDFTHPRWLQELKDKLEPAEPGLFRLKKAFAQPLEKEVPASCRAAPRFMLAVEVSTVYRQAEKARKIHHLLFVPDIASAERLNAQLARYGNLSVDGRPTLLLTSRQLLEIVLATHPQAFLIPAHIWTPWFGLLGSRSGFDSVEAAYGDLTPHIFAAETGLSADPAMCRRVPFLDPLRMVSFSDAHGPQKLGREMTELDTSMSFADIRTALETGKGYLGTLEFYPEEGKYHLDGHRACGVRFTPQETKAHKGICPVCKRRLTIGVLHRVEDLATRASGKDLPPTAGSVTRLIPLPEILAEIAGVGVESKRVQARYATLLAALGPERVILREAPLADISAADTERLAEAIRLLREEKVIKEPGYDGVYGRIYLFSEPAAVRKRA
jgi:DNA helicase-2/ATP-dependent DNA helicase PcrA